MNKEQLIDAIRSQLDVEITKKAVGDVLDTFMGTVIKTLSDGDKVILIGFGSFSVAKRKQRQGRNPRTGKIITIPAKNAVKFSAGKQFKEKVNKGGKKKK